MTRLFFLSFWLLFSTLCSNAQSKRKDAIKLAGKKMNVVLIAVDDLKPMLGAYGFNEIKTPSIDKLAGMGMTFKANYCQQAVCAPSRASLLTGLYPDITRVYDLQTLIRDKNPDIVTLPQHFKNEGYATWGIGKIFDTRSVDRGNDSISWSQPFGAALKFAKGFSSPVLSNYQSKEIRKKATEYLKAQGLDTKTALGYLPVKRNDISFLMPSTECLDVPDNAYEDGAITDAFIKKLRSVDAQPFFYAIGFVRPHLPFVAPKKYWDLYKRDELKLDQPQAVADNIPAIALHNGGELKNGYYDVAPSVIDGKRSLLLTESKQRELMHGYYASISYVDVQVGKILRALEKEHLLDNTIIVLFGDHGFHLGDHTLWCKHSNFEQATRSPLIIYAPGITKGTAYEDPSEHAAIFPTLCDLTAIQKPVYLSGESLLPALKNREMPLKKFAISQYPRSSGVLPKRDDVMGYSLRTKRYRYTEWIKNDFTTKKQLNPQDIIASELYDYEKDPEETRNLVHDPEKEQLVDNLRGELHVFFEEQSKMVNKYAPSK